MANSFAEAMAENFAGVFLQAGHFRRQATYLPKEGASRGLVCLVERASAWAETENTSGEKDTILVTVLRDESHELGGVATPAVGDRIILADSPTKHYRWDGDIVTETSYSHTLRFSVTRPHQIGKQFRSL